jgi:hypothetical protein
MTDVRDKVQAIFRRIAGDRAAVLKGDRYPALVNDRITAAILGGKLGSTFRDPVKLDGIGFHLVDWNSDAAFVVALLLYPEEFTDDEIRDGVELFLVHAPAHCLEAARLGGYSTENIFLELPEEGEEKKKAS